METMWSVGEGTDGVPLGVCPQLWGLRRWGCPQLRDVTPPGCQEGVPSFGAMSPRGPSVPPHDGDTRRQLPKRCTMTMTPCHGCATLMSHAVSSGGGTEFTTMRVPVLVTDDDGHQRAPVSLSLAVGRPGGVTKDSKRLSDSTPGSTRDPLVTPTSLWDRSTPF